MRDCKTIRIKNDNYISCYKKCKIKLDKNTEKY